MSQAIAEPTFTGYISSTHDALLIFECVRRGIMPKVPRRLRDDERKLIRSGSVFVFDEHESGIKRWTDGLLWSPSRILWNFLVYRQIEKKSGKGQDASSSGHAASDLSVDPLAHGFVGGGGPMGYGEPGGSAPSSARASPIQPRLGGPQHDIQGRGRAISSASDSSAAWYDAGGGAASSAQWYAQQQQQQHSMYAGQSGGALPPHASHAAVRREAELERALVGSLRNSYPFAKDGLCKKTISIQVDGSTQHLVSYYKVDDVRNGRLRTPLSLPEISGLNISPIILQKSNFRNPPDIEVMPDGSLRYRGDGSEASRRAGAGTGSGSDGTSGSEGRGGQGHGYSHGLVPQSPASLSLGMDPRYYAGPESTTTSRSHYPRRLSGTMLASDPRGGVSRFGGSSRYEPYSVPGSRLGPSGEASPMEAANGSGSAAWFANVSGASSSLGVAPPVRHRNTFSVREHPGPFPLSESNGSGGVNQGGWSGGDSSSPVSQSRALPWTSAAQHALSGMEALGRPRGATTGTWHPHSGHVTLADPSAHSSGGDLGRGSSAGGSDAAFGAGAGSLGLGGMQTVSLDGRQHHTSGLPALLGSSREHQQQIAARSATLESLAQSAGFREPSSSGYGLSAAGRNDNMPWSPSSSAHALPPSYGAAPSQMSTTLKHEEAPEAAKYMTYPSARWQGPGAQPTTPSGYEQWQSNGNDEHGASMGVYDARSASRLGQQYTPQQQQQQPSSIWQQQHTVDPSSGDLGPIMLTRPAGGDQYGGSGGDSSFTQ